MTDNETAELETLVENNLDEAERQWSQVGDTLRETAAALSQKAGLLTALPGIPFIEPGKPVVHKFVVLMADMRDSTDHIRDPAPLGSIVGGLQRLFYETSALLPVIAKLSANAGGAVTEYLGDGALAFFPVDNPPTSPQLARCVRGGPG